MKLANWIPALAVAAMAVACGGGAQEGESAHGSVLAQFRNAPASRPVAVATPAAPAAAAAKQVTVDEMLDWAESVFPQFFPAHEATLRYDIYSYRHYANGNYVGISDNGEVVAMGPYVGTTFPPVSLGAAADYACKAKPSACTTQVSYTVVTAALTAQTATAQVLVDGVSGSIDIPGFGTASTNDDYANVTWTGSVGGALRAGGNLLMACAGASQKDTRLALSSSFVRVTDLAELAGQSFRRTDCFRKDHPDQAGVFTFHADGSMTVPAGQTVPAAVRDSFFSDQGAADAGGTFRAQAYKVTVLGQTRYYLVFLNHDLEAGEDSVQFGDPQ